MKFEQPKSSVLPTAPTGCKFQIEEVEGSWCVILYRKVDNEWEFALDHAARIVGAVDEKNVSEAANRQVADYMIEVVESERVADFNRFFENSLDMR